MGIVLYGTGKNSRAVINRLGKENIRSLVDSDTKRQGELYYGFLIESIDCISDDDVVIVTPDAPSAIYIADQLEESGIERYCFWNLISDFTGKGLIDKVSEYELISDNELSRRHLADRCLLYKTIYAITRQQCDYLLDHIEAKDLKPAKGGLRDHQEKLIDFASNVFKDLYANDIFPILSAGNLLGYYRHNGFIPWDDDLDFKLLRPDYQKLIEFCKREYEYVEYNGKSIYKDEGKSLQKWANSIVVNNPKKIIAFRYPYHLQIVCGENYFEADSIDFFSIDSFNNNYNFSDHYRFLKEYKESVLNAEDGNEIFSMIDVANDRLSQYYAEDGDNLFYGVDNFEAYDYYVVNNDWLKREEVFPLKKVSFEGMDCYAPNNIERCLEYVFGKGYMDLPRNIPLMGHLETRQMNIES